MVRTIENKETSMKNMVSQNIVNENCNDEFMMYEWLLMNAYTLYVVELKIIFFVHLHVNRKFNISNAYKPN